jgi:hypothetical protein
MQRTLPLLAILVSFAAACGDDPIEVEELIRVDQEPPGANCEHGGIAVHIGMDDSADGQLQDDEIGETLYTCDVADGQVLTRTDEEPAGDNCSNGGAAVHTGVDSNANDALDDDEIAATRYFCEDVIIGDFEVTTDATALQLADIEVITGTLTITNSEGIDVLAPPLVHVGGDLIVDPANDSVTSISLDSLTSVDGDVVVEGAVVSLSIDALQSVNGAIVVVGSALTELDAPVLSAVGGSRIAVIENASLTSVSMPALVEIDGVSIAIDDNSSLVDIEFTALREVRGGELLVNRNRDVTKLALPALEYVEGDLRIYSTAAQTLALPMLTTTDSDLAIGGHPQLTDLNLDALEGLDGILSFSDLGIAELSVPVLYWARGVFLHHNENLTSVDFPTLSLLDSQFSIVANESLEYLEVPELGSVDLLQIWDDNALVTASFPDLDVIETLHLRNTTALESLSAPALFRVDTEVTVVNNAALTTIDMPALTWVRGSMWFQDNAALPDLSSFSAVVTLEGDLTIYDNDNMTNIGMTALETAANIRIGSTTIEDINLGNDDLEIVDLPALQSTGFFWISTNPNLVDLDLSSLSDVRAFHINRSYLLATCIADDVVAQFDDPETVSVMHTDDELSCQ